MLHLHGFQIIASRYKSKAKLKSHKADGFITKRTTKSNKSNAINIEILSCALTERCDFGMDGKR